MVQDVIVPWYKGKGEGAQRMKWKKQLNRANLMEREEKTIGE